MDYIKLEQLNEEPYVAKDILTYLGHSVSVYDGFPQPRFTESTAKLFTTDNLAGYLTGKIRGEKIILLELNEMWETCIDIENYRIKKRNDKRSGMQLGEVYKMQIDNGIDREPYYMITKLWNGEYMVFWNRDPDENQGWLIYDEDTVSECLDNGKWKLITLGSDYKLNRR